MSKLHRHVKAPLEIFKAPKRRFDYIHEDLVGALPQLDGKPHIFTIVDCFTCWPEAIPRSDESTESCTLA